MGLFSNLFGGSQQAELDAANARIQELENRAPETVTVTETVEVPTAMPTLTLVSVETSTTHVTPERWASAYAAGATFAEFLGEIMAGKDLSNISAVSLTTAGGSESYNLTDRIPSPTAPTSVAATQTGGEAGQ